MSDLSEDSLIEDMYTDEVINRLTGPLFGARQCKNVSSNDVSHTDNTVTQFAITVNIQPTKFMNKKQWRKYTPEQQTSQLARIESAFRRNNPSVKLMELHYETCPVLKNIHFHALYEMPKIFKSELETYYKRICDATDEHTKIPWRYLDIQQIFDMQGWLDYIRKGLTKVL